MLDLLLYGVAAVILILLIVKLVKGVVKVTILVGLILVLLAAMGLYDPLGLERLVGGIL